MICTSPASQPNCIHTTTTSKDSNGNFTSFSFPTPPTISVRKNEKYSQQPIKMLSLIDQSDDRLNLSGIIVKAMEIQQCSSGDYRRNIYIVDESTLTPFLISVFFKEFDQGAILGVSDDDENDWMIHRYLVLPFSSLPAESPTTKTRKPAWHPLHTPVLLCTIP